MWSQCCSRIVAVGVTWLPVDAAGGGGGGGRNLECGVDAAPGVLLLEQHCCLLMRQRGEAGVWSWRCRQSISVRATQLPNDSAWVKAGLWLAM